MNTNKQHKEKKRNKKQREKKERKQKTVEYCLIVVHVTNPQTMQTNCPGLRSLQFSENNIFNII